MGRGRPALHEHRQVADDIIRAALDCLETCSPQQLTIAEVAKRAQTRPSMVYYYFGGLEGLLVAILRQGLREIRGELEALHKAILANNVANPLRETIALFASSYNRKPAMMRILLSEILTKTSNIRSFFIAEWPAYGKLMMDSVISHLAATGFYRPGIDVERIGAMIRGVIFYPVIVKPYLPREGSGIEHYLDETWIDFVTTVFECYLRPA